MIVEHRTGNRACCGDARRVAVTRTRLDARMARKVGIHMTRWIKLLVVVGVASCSQGSSGEGSGGAGGASTAGRAGSAAAGGAKAGGAGASTAGGRGGSPEGGAGKGGGGAAGATAGGVAGGRAAGGAGVGGTGGAGAVAGASVGGATPPAVQAPVDGVGSDLRPSASGRYLQYKDGKPFFWLADTAYTVWNDASPETASAYFKQRAAQGFSVIKTYIYRPTFPLTPQGQPRDIDGHGMFVDADGSRPNEEFFATADKIVDAAGANGLHIIVVFDVNELTSPQQGAFARWLGARWKSKPQVIWWTMGGYNVDNQQVVEGVFEGVVGRHQDWQTASPDWARLVMTFYTDNMTELWDDAWATLKGYTGAKYVPQAYAAPPAKPITWADGQYEDGGSVDIDGYNAQSGLGSRATAYVVFLRGGFFTYGKPETWPFKDWQQYMTSEGAVGLQTYQRFWTSRAWEKVVPDDTLLTTSLSPSAAGKASDGSAVYAYVVGSGNLKIRLDTIKSANANLRWFDPAHGTYMALGSRPTGQPADLTTPAGWADALLVAEAAP